MSKDRIILNITPKAAIRVTQAMSMLFYVPEDCPFACGLPRKSQKQPKVLVETMADEFPDLWRVLGGDEWQNRRKKKEMRYGCPHSLTYENYMMKKRLERFNEYKKRLKELADEKQLVIPDAGFSIYYYLPIPKRWTKKKKLAMNGQLHKQLLDIDNITKGIFDVLRPQDKGIAQISGVGKFWVNQEQGFIEILLNQPTYNPFSVKFIQS
jgi:Holliday junction resolvase RusA-like endonuclease